MVGRSVKNSLAIGLIAVVYGCTAQGAPILLYTEAPLGAGVFQYEYTVVNDRDPITQAGFNIYDVLLSALYRKLTDCLF